MLLVAPLVAVVGLPGNGRVDGVLAIRRRDGVERAVEVSAVLHRLRKASESIAMAALTPPPPPLARPPWRLLDRLVWLAPRPLAADGARGRRLAESERVPAVW